MTQIIMIYTDKYYKLLNNNLRLSYKSASSAC